MLGDSATGTGTLTVDDTSTVYAGSGGHAIRPFNSGALVEMVNAGRIDLTGTGAGDVFTVRGNYRGDGGGLYLRTVLGADKSTSDRLVIDGGTATGTTGIGVLNAGGSGAATLADGILVVQALNGGRTAPGAFSLFAPVAAGAYEYFLFKGGVSAGTAENWYLRSTLVTGPTPAQRWRQRDTATADASSGPTAADHPGTAAAARRRHRSGPDRGRDRAATTATGTRAGGATQRSSRAGRASGRRCAAGTGAPPTPGARPAEGAVVPLYRVETATYAVVPPLLRETSLASLGTFHERQGEQRLLYNQGAFRTAWGRLVGQSSEIHWKGDAQPGFDGDVMGLQAGLDVWAAASDNHRNQIGVFVGRTRAQGKTTGLALGWENVQVGQNRRTTSTWACTGRSPTAAAATSTPWRCRAVTTAACVPRAGLASA